MERRGPQRPIESFGIETSAPARAISLGLSVVPRPGGSGADVALAGITSQVPTRLGEYSPYDFETRRALWELHENELYNDYRKLWHQNAYGYLCAEYLLAQILGSGYHFEGAGAPEVKDFFFEDNTRPKLEMALRDAITLGNGFLDLRIGEQSGKLKSVEAIAGTSVRIYYDAKGILIYQQDPLRLRSTTTKVTTLNPDLLLHLYIKRLPEEPYGMSLYRPNLHFLRSLEDVAGDIPAALKRIAYSPLVAKLDLDNFSSDEEKSAQISAFTEKLHKVIAASTNYVIDKRHELALVGSGGGAGARLLPVIQLIEPLIAVVLFNFGIPLGLLLQSGSNRAILREQSEGVRRFVSGIRERFKRDVDLKVVPLITGSRNAELVFDDDFSDWVRKGIFLARLYERGLISKEYIADTLNIVDKGTTFFPISPTGSQEKLPLRDDQLEDTDMQ